MGNSKMPLVAVVLGALVWWDNSPDASQPAHVESPSATEDAAAEAAPASETFGDGLSSVPAKESLTEMVERPLFAPNRRRPPVKTVAEAASQPSLAAPPLRPNYALLGVIRNGDRAIALLRSRSEGRTIRVEVGDMVGGWQITDADSTAIMLKRHDAGTHEIRLSR